MKVNIPGIFYLNTLNIFNKELLLHTPDLEHRAEALKRNFMRTIEFDRK